jgi:hypothetical protein
MKYWPAMADAPNQPGTNGIRRPEWLGAFVADGGTRKQLSRNTRNP